MTADATWRTGPGPAKQQVERSGLVLLQLHRPADDHKELVAVSADNNQPLRRRKPSVDLFSEGSRPISLRSVIRRVGHAGRGFHSPTSPGRPRPARRGPPGHAEVAPHGVVWPVSSSRLCSRRRKGGHATMITRRTLSRVSRRGQNRWTGNEPICEVCGIRCARRGVHVGGRVGFYCDTRPARSRFALFVYAVVARRADELCRPSGYVPCVSADPIRDGSRRVAKSRRVACSRRSTSLSRCQRPVGHPAVCPE